MTRCFLPLNRWPAPRVFSWAVAALLGVGNLRADPTASIPALPNQMGDEPEVPREVVVRGKRARSDEFELKIPAAAARLVAGTQGDPLKVVEALPGVARASLGSEPLLLWGAAPADSRSYVDGVEVPTLFHYGALRSVIHGASLADVSLTPGAYGAEFGRGLGGVLRVTTQAPPNSGNQALLDINTLDASAWGGSAITEHARISLAGRYGWLERLIPVVWKADSNFFALPTYRDFQAKAEFDLRAGESLSLALLGSFDSITHEAHGTAPGRGQRTDATRSFERVYALYKRSLDASETTVTPWFGRDQQRFDAHYGQKTAGTREDTLVWGIRANQRSTLSVWLTLNFGIDVAAKHGHLERDGSLTIPGREGDPKVFGQPPGSDVNTDNWHASSIDAAPYINADLMFGGLTITPGLRADGVLLEASRLTPRVGQTPEIGVSNFETNLQPRLSFKYRVSPRISIFAALGRYHQPPQLSDTSAVFGNPMLGSERAEHCALGESVAFTESLSLSAKGFYRALNQLAVRDASATPKLAQTLRETGKGQSYGVEFMLRRLPRNGFYGWVAVTLSRSERRDANGQLRLSDYDEPRVVTVVLGKSIADWDFGARVRYASGAPRTPVVGEFFNERSAMFEPVLGEHNETRLPDFWQIDVRVDRRFVLPGGPALALQLEISNATNHRNAEEYAYSADYTQRRAVYGLPLMAVLGARLAL